MFKNFICYLSMYILIKPYSSYLEKLYFLIKIFLKNY